MTLSASPALQRVETSLKLTPDSFAKNNYRSVFDIARTSRKQFIADNMSWLGLRGGKAWDLAMGQAQHIRRLCRENQLTRQIRQVLPQTLSGNPVRKRVTGDNIQGLVQDGPSWQNQFAEQWQTYCQSGSPEAVDSPVSYLTWMYRQALAYEQEIAASSTANQVVPLSERRPDLATLTIDDDAINQQFPTLQLVNEILESSIAGSLPAEQSVDVTLAQTRYPTLLPYHFPHDQVKLALENAGVPLEDIIGQTATDWPWFLNDSWRGGRSDNSNALAAMLASEQQILVTEQDNSTAADLTAFYTTNLGVETVDSTPFKDMDTFTRRLGITVPQVEQLIGGNEGGTLVTLSPNTIPMNSTQEITSANYGAMFINESSNPVLQEQVQKNISPFEEKISGEEIIMGEGAAGYAPTVVPGVIDYGVTLYGTQKNSIKLGTEASRTLAGSADFTIGFWFFLNASPTGRRPIACNCSVYDNGHVGFGISIQADNTLYVTVQNSRTYHTITSTESIPLNSWCYISCTWEAETQTLALFISDNGASLTTKSVKFEDTSGTMTDSVAWVFNESGNCNYYNTDVSDPFSYIIDDICIWDFPLVESNIQAVASSKLSGGGRSDVVFEYKATASSLSIIENLSNARMDRINRMVRLQRWLGLSFEETDLLLCACIRAQGANNTDYTLNAHTLRALGVFRHWQQKYGINAFQFAAVLDEITPYAISPAVPFFDQVFNAPSLFDAPFAITGETVSYTDMTGDSARTVRQICAGLDITEAQFRVLADKVAAKQGNKTDKTFPLTLPVVSAFYRLVMVPRWLGLSFADGAALLSLAGEGDAAWAVLADVPQLATLANGQPDGGDILDLLMALEAAAAWAREHHLSWVKNYLALQPATAAPGDAELLTSNTVITDGKFGQGIQTSTNDDSYFYFLPGGKVAETMRGDKSFTLGFWFYQHNVTSQRTPIFSNAGDANDTSYSSGFDLTTYNGSHHLQLALVDSNGSNVGSYWSYTMPANKWSYVALSWNAATRQAAWYIIEDGLSASSPLYTSDASALGDITTAGGFTWAFNTRGDLTRCVQSTDNIKDFTYNDIAIFNGALTTDEINTLATSDKTVAETDISGFSADCIWTLGVKLGSDALMATAATVNFVNGIKQHLPAALLSEQSFVSVPLPASATANSWLAVLSDLTDGQGLVLPTARDYATITVMVSADLENAGITFATEAEQAQAVSGLAGIVNQARQAQSGIADSALAQMFSTSQSLPPYLLNWAGDSEYRLLSESLTMNSGAALTDPAQIPATYLTRLFALGQRAGISRAFNLTPAMLGQFLTSPGWFGVSDTALTLPLVYRLSRYADWLAVTGDENRVLGYLRWVNAGAAVDAAAAAGALALLLDWERSEVADATASLPGELAKTVADVDYVLRLKALSAETGLSVTPLLATGELAPGGVTETWDAWQSAGESLVAAQSGQQ